MQYFVNLRNESRAIEVKISGKEAKEAEPVFQDCLLYQKVFEWGGMHIDTRDRDWYCHTHNTNGWVPFYSDRPDTDSLLSYDF